METERSLEPMTKHLAKLEKHGPIFNQHHQQFLDRLSDFNWMPCAKLPDATRNEARAPAKWMGRAALGGEYIEYRMTEAGLVELSRPH